MMFMARKRHEVYFRVYLNINTKHGKNALEIRTLTTDTQIIKKILTAAISNQPIIVYPTFRDTLKALAELSERKIIKYNIYKGKYAFLI